MCVYIRENECIYVCVCVCVFVREMGKECALIDVTCVCVATHFLRVKWWEGP